MNQHISPKPIYSRLYKDDESAKRARRFFGADFLFVIAILAIALIYFWPRMFQPTGKYVSEADASEVFITLSEIKDIFFNTVTKQNLDQDKRFKQSIDSQTMNKLTSMAAFQVREEPFTAKAVLLSASAEIMLGSGEFPVPFPLVQHIIQKQKKGAHVHTEQGIASFLLHDILPGTEIRVVVAKRYKPLFQIEK